MSVSRRIFLRSGAACALTVGALYKSPLAAFGQSGARSNPHVDFQLPYEATTNPVFYFTRATFDPYVGGVFSAPGVAGRNVQLTLVGISSYAPASATKLMTRPARRTDCFSLQFRATGQLRQLSTTHNMEHGALGKFDIFMKETEVNGELFYEAVINHVAS
jgi:hypothetical protein